jgi:hypothetical protein
MQNNVEGTFYNWHNQFINTDLTSIGLQGKYHDLFITLNYFNLNHYIYYGTDAMPHQLEGALQYYTASLSGKIKLWGHFYTDNDLIVQKTANTHTISLPTFIVRSRWYFERDAFHKASHVQMGFMVRYWSDYYVPDYMPATFQFFEQRSQLAHYLPVVDLFASMQIKTAQLFLRVANVGSFADSRVNFAALHYPMPDATVHFGVKWIMWN